MENKQKTRNSNFEILRIVSIILIIFSHCANYRWYQIGCQDFSLAQFWINLISMGGKIGVNCFLFISAYYLLEDKKIINLTKVLKIFLSCVFYFVLFYTISLIYYKKQFDFVYFIKNFFYPLKSNWWFIKFYLILLLIHPLLNFLIKEMNNAGLIVAMIICYGLSFLTEHTFYFIFVYFLTAFLKRYLEKFKNKNLIIIMVLSFIAAYVTPLIVCLLSNKSTSYFDINKYFVGEQSPFMLAIAMPMCLLAAKSKPFENKIINFVAPSTLSIYMIHEDHLFMRDFIWGKLFKVGEYQNSNYFVLYTILVCFIVFICCLIIDLIKRYTFDYLLSPVYRKISKSKISTLTI